MRCDDKALRLTHIFIVSDAFGNALTDWHLTARHLAYLLDRRVK